MPNSNYVQPLLQICKHFLQTVQAGGGDTKHFEVQLVCDSNYIFHVWSLMLTLIILMNSWYSLLYILNFPLADDCPMAYSCFVIEQNLHLVMESLDGVYGLLDFLITFCFIFLVALEVRRQFFCSTMLIMFYSFAQSLLNIFLIDFLLV